MSETIDDRSWRSDPDVRVALKTRPPREVSLFDCPNCGAQSYYNEGSYATCHCCGATFAMLFEDEGPPTEGGLYLRDPELYTVEDAIDAEVDPELQDLP